MHAFNNYNCNKSETSHFGSSNVKVSNTNSCLVVRRWKKHLRSDEWKRGSSAVPQIITNTTGWHVPKIRIAHAGNSAATSSALESRGRIWHAFKLTLPPVYSASTGHQNIFLGLFLTDRCFFSSRKLPAIYKFFVLRKTSKQETSRLLCVQVLFIAKYS